MAQKVSTTADSSFDFKNAKRYAWGQNHIITRQGHRNDVLIDEKIVEDVNKTLAGKGFVEDREKPDFYIAYDAGNSDPSIKVEGAYSEATPATTAAAPPMMNIRQNVWYSVNGQIRFQMVEAKSKKAIWAAVVTKKINDPHKAMKDMPKQVEQIVAKTFEKFPPK